MCLDRKPSAIILLKMQSMETSEVTRLTWDKLKPLYPEKTIDLLTLCPHPAHRDRVSLSWVWVVLCARLWVSSQKFIALAPNTVPDTWQCPIKFLLKWNVTNTFSYYSASQTVICLQFAQLNKGNLVKSTDSDSVHPGWQPWMLNPEQAYRWSWCYRSWTPLAQKGLRIYEFKSFFLTY